MRGVCYMNRIRWCLLLLLSVIAGAIISDVRSRFFVAQYTSFIYAPGIFGSPVVIGRYCSRYEAYTGEVVYGTRGADIFGDGRRVSAVVFPEIITAKSNHWFRSRCVSRIARTVFMKRFGICVREDDAASDTIYNYLFDPRRANIGQVADIAAVKAVFDTHAVKFKDSQIVLFGDSRGAASVFNFVAQYKPLVAACICEGVFDSIPHLVKHNFLWSWKGNFFEELLIKTVSFCSPQYNPSGPFPIDFADAFPRNIPLLLVTSVVDKIVPLECTVNLYRVLRELGHEKVHLLILPHSAHSSYMVGPDRDMYEGAVHAFYRTYGIVDYDAIKADYGQQFFDATQPSYGMLKAGYRINRGCCDEGRNK